MKISDQFVKQHSGLLAGGYDSLDRIVLHGYFLPGQNGGGMRTWWLRLPGDPVRTLKKYSLEKMATMFARRTRGGEGARTFRLSIFLLASASTRSLRGTWRCGGKRSRTLSRVTSRHWIRSTRSY